MESPTSAALVKMVVASSWVQVTRRVCRPFGSLPPGGHAHGLLDGLLGRAVASHRVCQQILLRGLALVVVGKRRDGQVQKPAVVSLLDTRPVRRHRVARGGANDLGEVGLIGVAPANDLFAIAYVRVRRAEQLSPGRGTPSRLPARSFRPSLFKPTTFERAPARPPLCDSAAFAVLAVQ